MEHNNGIIRVLQNSIDSKNIILRVEIVLDKIIININNMPHHRNISHIRQQP